MVLTVRDSEMLEDLLRAIVKNYGFARVDRALRELQHAGSERASGGSRGRSSGIKQSASRRESKHRRKVTALLYVEKLDVPVDVRESLVQLAKMFDDKLFLATMRDVKDFCIKFGVNGPTPSSRGASIPKVFRVLSTLPATDIQQVVQSGQFSGPARLAPIAEAIRRKSKHKSEEDSSHRQVTKEFGDNKDNTSVQSDKPSVPKEI